MTTSIHRVVHNTQFLNWGRVGSGAWLWDKNHGDDAGPIAVVDSVVQCEVVTAFRWWSSFSTHPDFRSVRVWK